MHGAPLATAGLSAGVDAPRLKPVPADATEGIGEGASAMSGTAAHAMVLSGTVPG